MSIIDRITAIERRISLIDTGSIDARNDFEYVRNSFSNAPASLVAIDRIIEENSSKWNVDSKLVKAIVENESGFNSSATSTAGAQGLMQLMPQTAAQLGVTNPYDPNQNIAGGVRYLRSLLDRFEGNTRLAVAAYNAGPNAVARYNGVPPYKETEDYVASVLASYQRYRGAG